MCFAAQCCMIMTLFMIYIISIYIHLFTRMTFFETLSWAKGLGQCEPCGCVRFVRGVLSVLHDTCKLSYWLVQCFCSKNAKIFCVPMLVWILKEARKRSILNILTWLACARWFLWCSFCVELHGNQTFFIGAAVDVAHVHPQTQMVYLSFIDRGW